MKTARQRPPGKKGLRRKKPRPKAKRGPLINTSFHVSKSFDELAREQGVGPLHDPSILAGVWPEDEDLDEFLRETYESR